MSEEIERIKAIIEKVFEDEVAMKRIRPASRVPHIQSQIFFKTDNPDYVRTTTTANAR
ncbi:hypothetical protein J4233_00300 [Candidatus Pacearchaeota archaeon]|nr:hypothetical protein [Candidatus Pacearchaeota archaeon]